MDFIVGFLESSSWARVRVKPPRRETRESGSVAAAAATFSNARTEKSAASSDSFAEVRVYHVCTGVTREHKGWGGGTREISKDGITVEAIRSHPLGLEGEKEKKRRGVVEILAGYTLLLN